MSKTVSLAQSVAEIDQTLPHNGLMHDIRSPLQAQVVQWLVKTGDLVAAGDVLVILEAMKMEHEIRAPQSGHMGEVYYAAGETVGEGDLLSKVELLAHIPRCLEAEKTINDAIQPVPSTAYRPRPDLQRVLDRHQSTLDANRPAAVAKRHALGMRTARETLLTCASQEPFKSTERWPLPPKVRAAARKI